MFLAILSITPAYAEETEDNTLGMVTGPKTGTYILIGQDIAKVAQKAGLNIDVRESKGSIDNIKRITSREKVSLALVQSDVLGFLSRSQNENSVETAKKLRMVVPIYNEEVHILASKDIQNIQDLNGKRVVVGSEGSGSMITSVNIFSMLGIKPAKLYQISPPEGVVAVLKNKADAMVFVSGKPVRLFKNMEELSGIKDGPNAGALDKVHFLALDDARLLKEYRKAEITSQDYSFSEEDVPTVAVTAVLINYDFTRDTSPYYQEQCERMANLGKALHDNLDWLRSNGHPKWKETDYSTPVGYWRKDECSWSKIGGAPEIGGKDRELEMDLLNIIRQSQ